MSIYPFVTSHLLLFLFHFFLYPLVAVELTNDGEHWSGGLEGNGSFYGTSILSTERFLDHSGTILDNYNNYTTLATFAVYTYIYPELYYHNPDIETMERQRCLVAVYGEEGVRQREEGWFMMKAHDAAFIDVNFTHLPSILNYPEHFELTIYMIPSRCTYELCSAARVSLTPQGSIQSTPTLPHYPPSHPIHPILHACIHTYKNIHTYILLPITNNIFPSLLPSHPPPYVPSTHRYLLL